MTNDKRLGNNYIKDGLQLYLNAGMANGATRGTGNLSVWKDLSPNDITCQLNNFAYTGNDGWVGDGSSTKPYGLGFNKTTPFIDCSTSNKLDITGNKTLEACFLYKGDSTGGQYSARVIEKRIDANNFYGLCMDVSRSPYFVLVVNGTHWTIGSTTLFPLNQVAHLTATFDSTTPKLYLNGEPITTYYEGGWAIGANSNFYIGGRADTRTLYGEIYYVRVYNKSLTEAEVKQNYNNGYTFRRDNYYNYKID